MENQRKPTSKFSNPFSGGSGWEIEYTLTSKKWPGVQKIWEEGNRERDPYIAKLIDNCKFITSVQIYQTGMMGCGVDNLKKRLNLLSRGYYLIKHNIKHDSVVLPIYSIGPSSCIEDLTREYKHNYYKKYSLTQVLKMLTVNQLFVKLIKNNYVRTDFRTESPFAAELEILNRKYGSLLENKDKIIKMPVISIRNYENEWNEIQRQISKVDRKTIVIAHNMNVVQEMLPLIQNNVDCFRFTTDEILFKEQLSDAFYKVTNGQIVKERITVFD